jgi:uncharacterized protein YdaT
MENELCHFSEDHNEEDLSESEESKHEHPQKRQKTENKSSLFDTTKPHEVIGNSVLMVAHTDAEAIEQLKEIESNALPQVLLSLKLQSVCHMLP